MELFQKHKKKTSKSMLDHLLENKILLILLTKFQIELFLIL